ncbi:MAG: hypothetical protein AAF085_14480 [Planctomycetota bacterium]
MPYWGPKPLESDYAFDQTGACIAMIKKRLFDNMSNVIAKAYPEQSIIASLQCIRLLAEEFPKCVSVSFRKKHFAEARAGFEQWYELVKDKIPAKYRESVLEEANKEFALFEERVLARYTPPS